MKSQNQTEKVIALKVNFLVEVRVSIPKKIL